MSHAYWFRAPLICTACGTTIDADRTGLHTSGLNPEWKDEWLAVGETASLHRSDFADAYLPLHPLPSSGDISVLEQWTCPECKAVQWARLQFCADGDRYRLAEIVAVPLTPEVLRGVNFMSQQLVDWIAANPGKESAAIASAISRAQP